MDKLTPLKFYIIENVLKLNKNVDVQYIYWNSTYSKPLPV